MANPAPAEGRTIFTIQKDAFATALAAVANIIEAKTTIPVLSNLLIETTGPGGIRITGTDLDTTVTRDAEAKVESGGFVCINAKKLYEIVKTLPEGDVTIEREKNNWAKLKCGKAKFRFAGVDRDQFPELPKQASTPIMLSGDTLRRMINLTMFAITNEQSRFTLSGAKAEIADGKFRMITTDGHRLSFVETAIDTDQTVDALIPKKGLNAVLKLDADEINFGVDDRHIYFATGVQTISTRRLSGQFPNYEMVLPKDNDQKAIVATTDLKAVIRRAWLMADERHRSIRLNFSPGEISVTAQSSEDGESEETLAADFAGEAITMGFNWHYVADVLGVIDAAKSTVIKFRDANSQTEFCVDGDEEFRYVVMPLRV